MRKVEQAMLQAITKLIGQADYAGSIRCSSNTIVEQNHHGVAHTIGYQRIISVRLHGNEVAAIRPCEGTVWLSDCGWHTATTKSRLNILIHALTRPSYYGGIYQEHGVWLRSTSTGSKYIWPGHDVFPLAIVADNYWLNLAGCI